MYRSGFVLAMPLGIALMFGGCGTFVPNLQEFSGNDADLALLVEAIVQSIHCDIRNAIYKIDEGDRRNGGKHVAYLDKWAAQVSLTLQVEEKTALSPTALWTPNGALSSIFSIGGSATASADATRIDKVNYFYTVKAIRDAGYCPGVSTEAPAPGSLLIQNDLKLAEWIFSHVVLVGTQEVKPPEKPTPPPKPDPSGKPNTAPNALSHQVTFEIITTGTVTPAWKLIKASVNQTGTPFSATRDRKHDLLITLGPKDTGGQDMLAATAQQLHFSAQIGQAVNAKSGPAF
jgi:hypothetical protein